MNKRTDNNDRKLALQEASEWLLRLQEDDVPDTDLEAWGNWMARSPANARAFDDVSALWEASASVTSESLDDAIRNKSNASRQVSRRPRRRTGWWVAAAMAAACGVIAVGLVKLRPVTTPPIPQTLATEKGERRHVVLADGSAVDLDADSRLTVDLAGAGRELVLERGRAHFAVAHDPSRPFRVQAGGIVGLAVGTRFSIGYRGADRISVVVDEGRVRVSQRQDRDAAPPASREAGRNERISYSAGGGLEDPRPVNADLAMSWREGSVVYQSERLSSVIADLNRYSRVPLRLEDASMGKLLVTGRWDSASIDSWVEGLARALRLQVVRRDDVILLAARDRSAEGGSPRTEPPPAPVETP